MKASSATPSSPPKPPAFIWGVLTAIALLLCLRLQLYPVLSFLEPHTAPPVQACPQVDSLVPKINEAIWEGTLQATASDSFKARAVDWLAGAIRIPTEAFDNMEAVGVDPRWNVFGDLHAYLAEAFPLVYANFKVRTVNTYGLWYEWTGSDTSLKPMLLMAHQDVVPVEPSTVSQWTHPPFSGYFDGHRIWGRGSSDDKNGLIGILSALEVLLENSFTPTRTLILAFGFDEEVTGLEGAAQLAKALLDTYGGNSFALVVDEGGGVIEQFGVAAAFLGVAEKGYLDVVVQVTAPGGHSSIPPDHTSIGILAAMLVQIEDTPHPVQLTRESTPYHTFQCLAAYGQTMTPAVKRLIEDSASSDAALHALEATLSKNPLYKAQIQTTTAIDVIRGGVKANALPEQVQALINHRILSESSVAAVHAYDAALLQPLAERFNLTFKAFGSEMSEPLLSASGALTMEGLYPLEPAPVSPTHGAEAEAFRLLSGSIRATFDSRRGAAAGGESVVVVPASGTGNTDTQFYWSLSPHIFRYGHSGSAHVRGEDDDILNGIHTVDEYIDADDFVEIIRFYLTLILNVDESKVV
ncbi:hypothetical protein FB45DRAFT_889258 [Roridomyces roridus]|uniref:Peptidase M20 dimerisation domain-containing protein n=1 Tax=Roridomyces roridus TaxID=1738132 RepID=A0AAD7CKN7_9AGAR|nr:hypothetical protein FB45DRAFT_889258 [Roridomyces roridus]